MRVYLAGPEVFHDDAVALGRRKREICAAHGHDGLYPIDPEASAATVEGEGASKRIFEANVALIEQAEACIANLSPFKGLDCDVGTAWEVAYAFARGKRVIGYANDPRDLVAKNAALAAGASAPLRDNSLFPLARTVAEDFGHVTNLMVYEAIIASGGALFTGAAADFTDLALFETSVRALAR